MPSNCSYLGKTVGSRGEDVYGFVFFIEKNEEKRFAIGPGEGQEVGFFRLDEALELELTQKTRLFLEKTGDLVEWMMKKRIVPAKEAVKKALEVMNG